MKDILKDRLAKSLSGLGITGANIKLDYPDNLDHGDLTTNAAMAYAKQANMPPRALAEKIVESMKKDQPGFVTEISIAGPGFINFRLKDEAFTQSIPEIVKDSAIFGRSPKGKAGAKQREVMIEYTDPNTFKAFHIGHLMSNAIGESISRLIDFSGAKVIRICYPSDIGLHIAKSIWSMQNHLAEIPSEAAPVQERTAFLGRMYVEGTKAYEENPTAKNEIDELNQVIYEKSDEEVQELYEKGREWSLDHFEQLYGLLGTHFDEQIFESEMAPVGLKIVGDNARGAFKESDGAIVFKGEEYGLHTRVFINSHGLPTYEAKEVGLNVTKFKRHPGADQSIVVTASEQNDYFRVLMKVFSLIDKENGAKTKHIGHGMLRFATGKMSSRTGNVITADALIADIKKLVAEKISDRKFTPQEAEEASNAIAIGAIKYTILRQAIGGDVIFDSSASISFEGDSGPYLQYSAVRAASIIEKAKQEGIRNMEKGMMLPPQAGLLERLLIRFPDVVERARDEYAPQGVTGYLTTLAGAFNSFYANQVIIDKKDPLSPYRVELTKAFLATMTNGLWLLGIKVPKKM